MEQQFVYKAKMTEIGDWPSYRNGLTDGDTMKFMVDLGFRIYTQFRYRVANLNTPELNSTNAKEREHAKQAKEKAREFLEGKDVVIKTFRDPRIYGRWEAVIVLPGGADFAEAMKAAGMERKETYE